MLFAALLYCNGSAEEEVIFYLSADILSQTQLHKSNLIELDAALPNVFILRGWEGSAKDTWVVNVTHAYVATRKYNVVAVDWSSIADNRLYPVAVAEVKEVGEYFALENSDVSLFTFHVCTHLTEAFSE